MVYQYAVAEYVSVILSLFLWLRLSLSGVGVAPQPTVEGAEGDKDDRTIRLLRSQVSPGWTPPSHST